MEWRRIIVLVLRWGPRDIFHRWFLIARGDNMIVCGGCCLHIELVRICCGESFDHSRIFVCCLEGEMSCLVKTYPCRCCCLYAYTKERTRRSAIDAACMSRAICFLTRPFSFNPLISWPLSPAGRHLRTWTAVICGRWSFFDGDWIATDERDADGGGESPRCKEFDIDDWWGVNMSSKVIFQIFISVQHQNDEDSAIFDTGSSSRNGPDNR